MPFTYKLACRLARLKNLVVGAAAVVAATVMLSCEVPIRSTAPEATVDQLIILPDVVTLQLNQDQDFMAVGLNAAGDTTPSSVTWTVTGGTLTDMGSSGGRHYGRYHGGACGSFRVSATSHPDGTTGNATVTVAGCPTPVASVTVTPTAPTVQVGQTVQLTATPKDANGNPLSGRVVTWSSNSTAVATVDGNGLVTAVAAGAATITATSEGQSGTASVTVSSIPVASVTVSPSPASVQQGATVQLTATPKDANGNPLNGRVVTWSSNNTAVARVNGSGLVTGVGAGTATITATSEGQSGTSDVTVTLAPVASVTVTPSPASVAVGLTVQLTATPKDANGNPLSGRVITWSTDNPSVATVDGSGLVTGAAVGSATITATSEGKSGTSSITVTAVPVASVTVTPSPASVQAGQQVQLTATLKDANGNVLTGRVVTWSSNRTSVATVGGNGLVSGVTAGSATITATSEGKSGTSSITVTAVPVASVTVSPSPASVQQGATVQLTATPKDANGNPLNGRVVTWSSNNTAVARVNGSGLVTGVGAGTATITATSEGQSGTSDVTVTLAPVASVTVTPSPASVAVGLTVQLTATPKDANGNPLSGRVVTWSSNNTAVATVNGSGLVSGVTAGSATITATSEGKTGTSAVTVTTPGTSQFGHVFIVTEENTDYVDVIGNSSMPYLNSLATQYGLATQYYANTHPSIGNYFELATGQILTNDDGSSTIENVPNVVRSLVAAGKTWKSYAESIPRACYLGGDTGNYARKHNVFALLSDVANDPTGQACNIVPFSRFPTDLANGTLPHFSNIVPDLCNDAHDCGLDVADSWLQTNIAPLIASPVFQQDGLLIIVFDESGGDNTNGGGRVAWVAVSPKSKRGYQSTTQYQHESTLRLILKGLGVTPFPGDAAGAPDMTEFFNP